MIAAVTSSTLLNYQIMKTLKMSLENIQGKMSRIEMRNIMAGIMVEESNGGGVCGSKCSKSSDCGQGGQYTCSHCGSLGECSQV